MIEITQETKDRVATILEGIPRGAERAFSNAINRALAVAKTQAYKGVMQEYAIKRSVISEYTKETIKQASSGDVCGTLIFSGRQIPLYKYKPTNPKQAPSRKMVYGGQKSKQALEHAFVTSFQSGHVGIFERVGKNKYPVRELMGSSMRSMVSNAVVIEKVYNKAQEKLDERLEHEISRLLAGYGG